MSQSITTLLDTYETAVENDDFSEAADTLELLTDQYENHEIDEEVRVMRSLLIRDAAGLDTDATEPLQTYVTQAIGSGLTRTGFLTAAAAYLSDPATVDRTETLDATRTLRERETALDAAAADIADRYNDVTLPAAVDLLSARLPEGPYLKGKSDTLTIVVANVGDSSTEGSVTVTQPSGLGVSPTSTDLTLAAGERATVEVTVSYDTDGEYKLEVELDAGDAGVDVSMVRIDVDTKLDLINAVLAGIDTLQERVEEAESLGTVQRTALDAELLLVEEQVELAQGLAEGGSTLLANTTLETAIIKMGAYLNELNLLLLEPDIHQALEKAGELLIDQLVDAKHAEL